MAAIDLAQLPRAPRPEADAVFEGGGVLGIAFVGALEVAESLGYTAWQHVAGTSAGAIVAACLAAGYHAAELKDILYNQVKFTAFMDERRVAGIPIFGAINVLWNMGLYRGDYAYHLFQDILGRKNMHTFGDLIYDASEPPSHPRRYKLNVVASDVSCGRMLVLPGAVAGYGMNPDYLEVARAIRMSMSIPFFFEPVRVDHLDKKETSIVVDGGLLSNYPVDLFDVPPGQVPRWPTFGFRLITGTTTVTTDPWHQICDAPIRGDIDLARALIHTMLVAHDQQYLTDHQFVRSITIPTGAIDAHNFALSKDDQDLLYHNGQIAAEVFFKTWNFQTYVQTFRTQLPVEKTLADLAGAARHARLMKQ
jgi:NTE family protein